MLPEPCGELLPQLDSELDHLVRMCLRYDQDRRVEYRMTHLPIYIERVNQFRLQFEREPERLNQTIVMPLTTSAVTGRGQGHHGHLQHSLVRDIQLPLGIEPERLGLGEVFVTTRQ